MFIIGSSDANSLSLYENSSSITTINDLKMSLSRRQIHQEVTKMQVSKKYIQNF